MHPCNTFSKLHTNSVGTVGTVNQVVIVDFGE
jgi:hypothetical protein